MYYPKESYDLAVAKDPSSLHHMLLPEPVYVRHVWLTEERVFFNPNHLPAVAHQLTPCTRGFLCALDPISSPSRPNLLPRQDERSRA